MKSTRRVCLSGLMTAAGTMACVATLAGFLGSFNWLLDLASHFRMQYAVTLVLLAVVMIVLKYYYWVAVFTGFALINAVVLTPRFLPSATPAVEADRPVLRALLANVNSANRDVQSIQRLIFEQNPDVIVLLEVTSWWIEQLAKLAEHYPHHVIEAREDNFGIAVFSQRSFLKAQIIQMDRMEPPSVVAEFVVGEESFTLLGTHPLPPISSKYAQRRNEQLLRLAAFARQTQQPLLVLGDLNISPWSPYFYRLLAKSGLHDSADGRGLQASWSVGLPILQIPIDHALFSDGILIQRREVGSAIGSDHYPILVEFQIVGS